MRKIFILIILLGFCHCAAAQESMDSDGQSWDSILKDYNTQQFQKPVTSQEYQQALETLKSYQKKPKTKKKHWWSLKKEPIEQDKINSPAKNDKSPVKEIPPSPDPLLRLPYPIIYANRVTKDGFYLVDSIMKNNRNYMRIKEGSVVLAEIEAQEITSEDGNSAQNNVWAEISGKNLKIIYKNNGIFLQTTVPVYIPAN